MVNISAKGIDLIQSFEGFRATAYDDVAGKRTIGYGHLLRPSELETLGRSALSKPGATTLMLKDLAPVELYLSATLPDINQAQFDALCSFAFNLGLGTLEKSTLFRYVHAASYFNAAQEFARWTFAGGVKVPGLIRRRLAEKKLFSSGVWP